MKSKYLLLTLLASAGLVAAEATAPAAAPAAEAPKAEAPKSKVPGVSDEDYQRYINTRVGLEKSDPQLIALKATAEEAKKKAKDATDPEAKKAAEKEFKAADKAYSQARAAAVLAKSPELKEVADKITAYWAKESVEKNKKKKAAEAAAAADAKK
jgi:hypothetical protein